MKRWIPFIICVICFSLGLASIIDASTNYAVPDKYNYEGKVLMSEEEYTEFKKVIAREDVYIWELNAYSSESPLVIFDVDIPVDIDFPWGSIDRTLYAYPDLPGGCARGILQYIFVIIGGVCAFIFGIIAALPEYLQ